MVRCGHCEGLHKNLPPKVTKRHHFTECEWEDMKMGFTTLFWGEASFFSTTLGIFSCNNCNSQLSIVKSSSACNKCLEGKPTENSLPLPNPLMDVAFFRRNDLRN